MNKFIPRAVRELVDGIRKYPERLELACSWLERLIEELESGGDTRRELEAERAAHMDTARALGEEAGTCINLRTQLSSETAARKEAERKLDALTNRLAEAWSEGWDQRDRRESGGYANNPYHPKYQGINPAPEYLDATEKAGSE